MRKGLTFVLMLLAAAMLFAGQSGKIGPNATWHFEGGEFSITGSGETYDGSYSYNGMYVKAPHRTNAHQAPQLEPEEYEPIDEPYGVVTFKYGAEVSGDKYTFEPAEVTSIVIGEGITKLGEWTCAFFTNAQTVQLPSTLVKLGGGAFLHNESLTSVVIPENVDSMRKATCYTEASIYGPDIYYGAFSGCYRLHTVYWNARGNTEEKIVNPLYGLESVLTNIVLGKSVVHIPQKLCVDCKKLTGELVIEKNVRTIGYAAFAGCTGINKINLQADSLETRPSLFMSDFWYYYNDYGSPFAMCNKNLEIYIGKDVEYIGQFLFSAYARHGLMNKAYEKRYNTYKDVSYMDSVHVTFEPGSKLKGIGQYAFAGVKGVADFPFPETLEVIDAFAFYDTDFKTLEIPSNIQSIGGNAFGKCASLSTVRYNAVDANLKYATHETEQYASNPWVYVYESPFLNCANPLHIIIGKDVKYLPSYIFSGADRTARQEENQQWTYSTHVGSRTDIQSVTIEEGSDLNSIRAYAFAGCSALEEFDFSPIGSRFGISDHAFRQTGLTRVHFPDLCSYIGDSAFLKCTKVDTFFVERRTPPSLGTKAFPDNAKIAVPCKSKTYYRESEEWAQYEIVDECMGDTYIISGEALPADGGTILGVGKYAENTEVTITADAAEGYHFGCWDDGNTEPERTFTADQDMIYYAVFVENTPTGGNIVEVEATESTATLTTQTIESIYQYVLTVYEGKTKVQTLYFDEEGQRLEAPGRAPKSNELVIQVTDLEEGTQYRYTLDALNWNSRIVNRKEGKFTTQEAERFLVRFYDWDDELLKRERVIRGHDATPPEDPYRAGYKFVGWDEDYTNVTRDLIIYAQYRKTQDIESIQASDVRNQKVLRDGQLYIMYEGKMYNVLGTEVR